ncbi:hypothetical protein [Pedobacter deserti]|uniref:hypothetical protein n=1 Tax=Pedobacter deserti TaxID=2817382 RepID=UPI00210C6598|nr:hypothetical protein [Pedobacter sp. SYSU D00382]
MIRLFTPNPLVSMYGELLTSFAEIPSTSIARKKRVNFQQLVIRYLYERLLYRLPIAFHEFFSN